MAPGDAIRFAMLCEFGCGVGTCGVEQPIVGRFVDNGAGYQRLSNQARDRVGSVRLVHPRLGRNGADRLKREVSDKD